MSGSTTLSQATFAVLINISVNINNNRVMKNFVGLLVFIGFVIFTITTWINEGFFAGLIVFALGEFIVFPVVYFLIEYIEIKFSDNR